MIPNRRSIYTNGLPTIGGPNQLDTLRALPGGNVQRTMADLMGDYRSAQSDLATADRLSNAEYIKDSGVWGALAMAAQAWAGSKLREKAEKRLSDYAREYFEMENERERRALAEQQAAEERRIKALMGALGGDRSRAEAVAIGGASVRDVMPKEAKPPAEIATFQEYQRMTPEQRQAFDAYQERRRAPAPQVNIDMPPGITAFERESGKRDAQRFDEWRGKAVEAAQTLERLKPVEEILGLQQTGRTQEALALAGQFFGTEAGANMQALRGAVQPLVLSQVKQLGSGNGITDADRKFIEAGMPGFGNDPRANERVIRIMRTAAEANIKLFDEADRYVRDNRSLSGFRPSVTQAAATPEAARTVTRTGRDASGRKVVQYSDGSIEYAD